MHICCYSFRIVSLPTIESLKYSNVDKIQIKYGQYVRIDFWEFAVID